MSDEHLWGDNYPPPQPRTVNIQGIRAWKDTMAASIDLLVAVEQADEMLIPDDVQAKALRLRAVFNRFA